MPEFEDLPPLRRAKRYRKLANDARLEASTAIGRLRESYLLSAERWDKLADRLESDAAQNDLRLASTRPAGSDVVSDTSVTLKPRLLAVDDDPDGAELVIRLARKCGYESRSITDPQLMDQVISGWKPQVVTLDLCMPNLDGLEASSLLQARNFIGHLVFVSAQDHTIRNAARHLAEARGLRVAGTVSKPVDTKTLRELLSHLHLPSLGSAGPFTGAAL
jgi:CheY-like chemotaxis protein